MTELAGIIAGEIRSSGPIPFSRFMERCLYHPTLGYYRRQVPPIGKAGDFYTSPCVHQIFGALIARQIAEIFDALPECPLHIVEGGAGRGHLARDIGSWLKEERRTLHDRITLLIVEPHRPYRDCQFALVKDCFGAVEFVESPDELPHFSGIFYSNELFDAFPVDVLEKSGGQLRQIYVGWDEKNGFLEIRDVVRPEIARHLIESSIDIPDEFRTEAAPSVAYFYRAVAEKIQTGAILTIDYGYPRSEYLSPQHRRGTLMGYHRHRATEDVYAQPGEQDMTAHLDFTTLKDAGEAAGFATVGFAEQEYFLMGAGFIDEMKRMQARMDSDEFLHETAKVKTLVMPGGMGSVFKVLCQAKRMENTAFSGFGIRNRRALL